MTVKQPSLMRVCKLNAPAATGRGLQCEFTLGFGCFLRWRWRKKKKRRFHRHMLEQWLLCVCVSVCACFALPQRCNKCVGVMRTDRSAPCHGIPRRRLSDKLIHLHAQACMRAHTHVDVQNAQMHRTQAKGGPFTL